jgi:hypothetical protein
VFARQGDQQEAREVGPDQPVQPIGRWNVTLIEGQAVSHQEYWPSGDDAVMSCGAHATSIAAPRS